MVLPSTADEALRAWHIAGLALASVVFASPTLWQRFRPDLPPYLFVTMALAAVLALLAIRWPRPAAPSAFNISGSALACAAASLVLLGIGLHTWMEAMLWQPLDPARGDMLVVVQAAIRAALKGRNPYAMYHVPWDAPLPYGAVLWAPFAVPQVLHADPRLITIAGEAFVPVLIAAAAVLEAGRRRISSALAWMTLLAAIVFNPDLVTFTTVGHTPSYWPLIPLFALFVATGRWRAAALIMGLLVVGRSTMVAIVPVFYMAVWRNARRDFAATIGLAATPILLLIAPFALWNFSTIWDGMVASYPRVMKGVVWTSPDGGAIKTIGVTGWLLAHQLQRFVEAAQAIVLAAIYAVAWRAIARGRPPLPWMALALFGFCATTLWPVYYIYFDVLLLFVSCAVAETFRGAGLSPSGYVSGWAGALVATTAAVGAALWLQASPTPVFDFSAGDSRALYKGFTDGRDQLSGSAAIWGTEATLAVPRRSARDADIVVNVEPVLAAGSTPQGVTATLNGELLGTVFASAGRSDIRFHAPASAWHAGNNALELACTSSARPVDVGLGSETRHLSLALRRLDVVEP